MLKLALSIYLTYFLFRLILFPRYSEVTVILDTLRTANKAWREIISVESQKHSGLLCPQGDMRFIKEHKCHNGNKTLPITAEHEETKKIYKLSTTINGSVVLFPGGDTRCCLGALTSLVPLVILNSGDKEMIIPVLSAIRINTMYNYLFEWCTYHECCYDTYPIT